MRTSAQRTLRTLPCDRGPHGARSRPVGAGVEVPFSVVDEVLYGEQRGAFSLLGQRGVGAA
jgi:hypothetical protein